MKAIILCGGFGTRLGDLTTYCPKPLLSFNNKRIIEWQIILLKNIGVDTIYINLHYLAEDIISFLKDRSSFGIKIHYKLQSSLNGTGGAVNLFRNELKNEKFFFVIYGDILTNENFNNLINFHIQNKNKNSMYVHERINSNSLFHINKENGLVLNFIERPTEEIRIKFINQHNIKNYWVNSAIYIFSPSIFYCMPKKITFDIVNDIFPSLVRDKSLSAIPLKGMRYAIDTVEKYKLAKSNFIF
ncbi:nucleotidyltransferase family protein [bacterium]|nr:nucleotidyltransferase family protein [bacterium]